jgi:predicted acyltransferase (DUF342 family)
MVHNSNSSNSDDMVTVTAVSNVRSTAVRQRGNVRSTVVRQRGNVRSTAVRQRGNVRSTAVRQRGNVRSTAVRQRGNATGQNVHSVKIGYLKTAQLSLKPASIVDGATDLRILKYIRNLQSGKKEPHSDTEHGLFYLVPIFCTSNLLLCIALHVEHLSPRTCHRRPVYIPL